MALFTDGPPNAAIDLQKYENAILLVANMESIDLQGKMELAQDEIGNRILLFLQRRFGSQRAQPLTGVVVTAPMRKWHAHKTLALIYRDAYNNQLNDRYKGKWNAYEQLASESARQCLQIGIGLVSDPVPKAGLPILATAAGAGLGATFYVAVTWLNQAGEEGCPSDSAEITTSNGEQLLVGCSDVPANVSGWNAYVGTDPDNVTLQNSIRIEIGSSWTMAGALQRGALPGEGQKPSWTLTDEHVLQRG